MKKLILIIIIILIFCYGIKAQNNYFKLIDTNKVWNYTDISAHPPPFYTYFYRFITDTTINGLQYYIPEHSSDSINWSHLNCFFREDITNKKVYILYNNIEGLVYDFNANIDDTIHLFHYGFDTLNGICEDTCLIKITSIDSVLVGVNYRKRFFFDYINCPNQSDYWIEGIGYEYRLFKQCFDIIGGVSLRFICYYENNTLEYVNPFYGQCFSVLVNNETENMLNEQLLLRNMDNNYYILQSILPIEEISIYNLLGIKIKKYVPLSEKYDIDFSHFSTGIYFISVKITNNLYSLKIIKP